MSKCICSELADQFGVVTGSVGHKPQLGHHYAACPAAKPDAPPAAPPMTDEQIFERAHAEMARGEVYPLEHAETAPQPYDATRCELCGHSLKDNQHGFDQNDAKIVGNRLEHSGSCTYCRECNPREAAPQQESARELREENARLRDWIRTITEACERENTARMNALRASKQSNQVAVEALADLQGERAARLEAERQLSELQNKFTAVCNDRGAFKMTLAVTEDNLALAKQREAKLREALTWMLADYRGRNEALTAIIDAAEAALAFQPAAAPCVECGHAKDDSRFHFDAPGNNWGAALHHYVAKPAPEGK